MRTTINDRGEEVNEEVWENSQEAAPSEEQEDEAAIAQPQASAARSPAGKSPEKASQDDALKEQPGQYGASGLVVCTNMWECLVWCVNMRSLRKLRQPSFDASELISDSWSKGAAFCCDTSML